MKVGLIDGQQVVIIAEYYVDNTCSLAFILKTGQNPAADLALILQYKSYIFDKEVDG
jgi:hypothetical protein